jgi:hypothetical protein
MVGIESSPAAAFARKSRQTEQCDGTRSWEGQVDDYEAALGVLARREAGPVYPARGGHQIHAAFWVAKEV